MNARPKNVLVTGVGAIIGYGIVRSLTGESDVLVHGIDIYPDAIGRIWCDKFSPGVRADSNEFIPFIKQYVQQNKIDLIIPGIEQDLDVFNDHRQEIEAAGVVLAINAPAALDIFGHKLKTYEMLRDMGLAYIPFLDASNATLENIEEMLGSKVIVKPYRSYAGKGLRTLTTCDEKKLYCGASGHVIQRLIESGAEYTASAFGLGNGEYRNLIILSRSLGPDGATHKAKTFFSAELTQQIGRLCEQVRPLGPTNFQFIKDEGGQYYLLEVNPRISSSTSIRQSFGVNEARMCVDYFLYNQTPENSRIRSGVAQRYIADHIEYDSDNS